MTVSTSTELSGADQAQLPIFRALLAVQAVAGVVFGLIPLLAPAQFASITGYSGDDELIYRLAGAATAGYLVAALLALTWRCSWRDLRIPLVATLTFTAAAALGSLVSLIGGDRHWAVVVVLLAATVFAVLAAYWLRRDEGPPVPAGKPLEPVVKGIIALATISAGVFGLLPLIAPGPFASLFGLLGTDIWIYRMAGAACLGYAIGGILELQANDLGRIRVQNAAAIAFNIGGASAAWLAILVTGHGGLLAPVIAAAATTFSILLIWIQRSIRAASRG
jgi:hypothetical protein